MTRAKTRFFLFVLLPIAALIGSNMAYALRSESVAENLVRAMRSDQFALQGTLAAYLKKPDASSKAVLTDGQRRDFLVCVGSANTSVIVRALAVVLVHQLSPDEIQQALAFYDSSAGKKQVQRELAEAQKMFGYELAMASPELSDQERAILDRFKATTAYARLQEFPLRIREAREVRSAILQSAESVASACSQTVGLPIGGQ